EPRERNHAVDDAAEVLGGLLVERFGPELRGNPAVDVAGGGKPFDLRKLTGDLIRKLGLAGDEIEPADRPGVVRALDLPDEVHHLAVAGDALAAQLRVDRVLHGGDIA